jgi:hypothetical protein
MTPDEYRAVVRASGLTPYRPSFQGSTLHKTSDGKFLQVCDPEHLSSEERAAIIAVVKALLGIANH